MAKKTIVKKFGMEFEVVDIDFPREKLGKLWEKVAERDRMEMEANGLVLREVKILPDGRVTVV